MTEAAESPLRLGPLLRHVGETHATLWVQTSHAATVTVTAGARHASTKTFTAFGFHYALVLIEGLEPGSVTDYTVDIDAQRVWPPADSNLPPSRIATLDRAKPTRLAFGSCRTSSTHDREGNKRHGVDALRAYAAGMAPRAKRSRTTSSTTSSIRGPGATRSSAGPCRRSPRR